MSNSSVDLGFLGQGVQAVAALLAVRGDAELLQEAEAEWTAFDADLDQAPADDPIATLMRRGRLNEFERKCLLMAAGLKIDPSIFKIVRTVGKETFSTGLTVRLVVDAFVDDPVERYKARQSFLESSPLIEHRLIKLGPERADAPDGILASTVEITQPTLRYLLGEESLAGSLGRTARLYRPNIDIEYVITDPDHTDPVKNLVLHQERFKQLVDDWGFGRILPYGRGITLLFSGPSGTGKTLLANALATSTGRPILSISGADIPKGAGAESMLRDLFTEALLRGALVLIDECDALFGKRDPRLAAAFHNMEGFTGIVILITNHPDLLDEALERRILYHYPFELPNMDMRLRIWVAHLPAEVPVSEKLDLVGLASRYDFSGGEIKNAVLVAVNRAIVRDSESPAISNDDLVVGCTSQLRYALDALTERSTTKLTLDNLVLPKKSMREITGIISACKNQNVVLNHWGFGDVLSTGKGITCLFDGPPGTGKTLTAEILAGEIGRPLYRISLPDVVSKWVGETEKHIKQVFQHARISHAILLFDEADALFAKRSKDVSSSNDRYANMEVNLLLQEIERFTGTCILTTNNFGLLDDALIRRIQFRVRFEEPSQPQRAKIWQTLCPASAPLASDVNFEDLSWDFEMTGGNIKNALMRAAYRAADQAKPSQRKISQAILREACQDECSSAGKLVYIAELANQDPSKTSASVTTPAQTLSR